MASFCFYFGSLLVLFCLGFIASGLVGTPVCVPWRSPGASMTSFKAWGRDQDVQDWAVLSSRVLCFSLVRTSWYTRNTPAL